jgi:integrase
MPRRPRIPAYRLHKPSGQARVILLGKQVYLGPFGSPASREKYARLIAAHVGGSVPAPADPTAVGPDYPALSVNELLLRYLQFAEGYYRRDGQDSGEVANVKDAMRPLRTLYGLTRADAFGPRALKLVRQHMIGVDDLSRGVVNARVDRIKRIFRWAVSEELLPPASYEGLRTVAGLRYGRCDAREAQPVRPAADQWVETTLKFLPPVVADMVRLQRLTGMRSGNLVTLRAAEIDRSGGVWVYEPARHKTQHHKRRLQILIGPQGQVLLRPYLDRGGEEFLFCPAEAEAWRARQRRLNPLPRKTTAFPCEVKRLKREKQARKRRPRVRPPGPHYTTHSYRRVIAYAVEKANAAGNPVPNWHPHQLRHSRATEVRRDFGIEGAQVVLGHARASITEVYAERDLEFAKRIARKTG